MNASPELISIDVDELRQTLARVEKVAAPPD